MPKNVSDWHKKQRKKEIQKNKASRIAARDEKVKTEKTEQSVREEIRKLERQYKNAEARPHNIKSKLDRLQKELKLVQEEAAKNKPAQKRTYGQQPKFQPLQNPALSVYYDPVMNPYGEPPPGKPRLYHRRDGGVTMNLAEAGMPGEPEPPRAPPPPPPPRHPNRGLQQQQQPQRHHQREPEKNRRSQTNTNIQTSAQPPPPPPPPPNKEEAGVARKKVDPSQLPSLPPPSAAVGRSKRKLAADIWASTEEMEYEEAVGVGTLEGVASSRKPTEWQYRDTSGNVQGPFPTDQMIQWVQAAFFPETTLVRPNVESPWKPLRSVKALVAARHPPRKEKSSSVQDRIAALRRERTITEEKGSSVEDRIAALRRGKEQNGNDSDNSVQKRIAALKGQNHKAADEEEESDGDKEEKDGNEPDNSVQNRIAALKAQSREEADGNESDNSVQNRIAALKKQPRNEGNGNESDTSLQKRIAALKAGNTTQPAGPAAPSEDMPPYPLENEPAAYPIEEGLPAPYPVEDLPAAYPVDDEVPPAPYPVEDAPAPYPVDDMPAYPVDEQNMSEVPYPVVEDSSCPVTGEYPMEDGPVEKGPAVPPKKKVKVDKELVAFLPSHLQKRRAK